MFESEVDTGPDCLNRSLNPFEIPRRSCPHHAPALRAAPAPQQDLLRKTVKKGRDKTMTPDPMPLAPRTHLRSWPRKIPPTLNNLLDGNAEEDYH
jgi:hypothetical protein